MSFNATFVERWRTDLVTEPTVLTADKPTVYGTYSYRELCRDLV